MQNRQARRGAVDASLAEADGDEDDAEEGVELAGFWGGCLRRRPTCFGF